MNLNDLFFVIGFGVLFLFLLFGAIAILFSDSEVKPKPHPVKAKHRKHTLHNAYGLHK